MTNTYLLMFRDVDSGIPLGVFDGWESAKSAISAIIPEIVWSGDGKDWFTERPEMTGQMPKEKYDGLACLSICELPLGELYNHKGFLQNEFYKLWDTD